MKERNAMVPITGIFLTGKPRVGKTTVILRTVHILRSMGKTVGGILSSEIIERGARVGFELIDLLDGNRGVLSHIHQREGPMISKYRVNLIDLNIVGAAAVRKAIDRADVIVIDEVGPMELFSQPFKEAVRMALASSKSLLGTLHRSASDPLASEIRGSSRIKVIEVTVKNREELPATIVKALQPSLGFR
jgi:nucleoside-triphosphatase